MDIKPKQGGTQKLGYQYSMKHCSILKLQIKSDINKMLWNGLHVMFMSTVSCNYSWYLQYTAVFQLSQYQRPFGVY